MKKKSMDVTGRIRRQFHQIPVFDLAELGVLGICGTFTIK